MKKGFLINFTKFAGKHPEADLGLLQHPRWSFQPLTIITKCAILDIAAVLDPPLNTCARVSFLIKLQASGVFLRILRNL